MKFNIEVDVNDLFTEDEDGYPSLNGSLSEIVKYKILEGLTSQIQKSVDKRIEEAIQEKVNNINNVFDERLNELMENFMDKKITITDKYGDIIEENTSVKEMLKRKCDNFLDAKVDSKGIAISEDAWGYRDAETRIEYILRKKMDSSLKREIERAVDNAVKEVKNVAQKELNKKLGEKMVKAFEMGNVFDNTKNE